LDNQSPFTIAVARAAEHLKRHSNLFVQDGPESMTREQRAAHKQKIELCADRIGSSKTYVEFETTMREAHRLGTHLDDGLVSAVAHASLGTD
jgi:hypothetical protein